VTFTNPSGAGGTGLSRDEDTQRQISTTRNRLRRVLGTATLSDAQRREAETALERLEAFELGSEDPARLNPFLSGLLSTVAVPNQLLGGLSGVVSETVDFFQGEGFDFDDLFEDVTGVSSTGLGFWDQVAVGAQFVSPWVYVPGQGQGGWRGRDISLQGTFAEPLEGTGAVGSLAGFVLDVGLDPLNYLGGAGLYANAARRGATLTRNGSRLMTNSVNRSTWAIEFNRVANTLIDAGDIDEARKLQQIAHRIGVDGIQGSRLTMNEELLEVYEQYAHLGRTFKVPFGEARQLPEIAGFLGLSADILPNRVRQLSPRRVGERVGGRFMRFRQDGRRFANAARAADEAGDVEIFARYLDSFAAKSRSRATAGRFAAATQAVLRERLPDVEVSRRGRPTLRGEIQLQRLNRPGFGTAVRDAIEAGADEVEFEGVTESITWVRDMFGELRSLLGENDIVVGEVENFFPRVLDADFLKQQSDEWLGAPVEARSRLREQRKYAPGMPIGFDPRDGSMLVLRDGSIEEVDEMFRIMGEEFADPFEGRLISTLESYLRGLQGMVEREALYRELGAVGALRSADSLSGQSVPQLLANTAKLRIFEGAEVQAVLAKILPDVRLAEVSRIGAGPVRETIANLRVRRMQLREEAVGRIPLREEYRAQLSGISNQRRRRANRETKRVIDEYGIGLKASSSLRAQIDEIDSLASELSDDATTLTSRERLAGERQRLVDELAEVDEALEYSERFAQAALRDADDELFDEYFEVTTQLSELEGLDLRGLSTRVIDDISGDLRKVAKLPGSRASREAAVRSGNFRTSVMTALSNSSVSELVTTVRQLAGEADLSPRDLEVLRPVLTTLETMVRFDSTSLRSMLDDPQGAMDMLTYRSRQMFDRSEALRASAVRNGDRAKADMAYQGHRLAEAANMIVREALQFKRQIDDLPLDDPRIRELQIQYQSRMVYAQEAALHSELASMGTPFSGDRFLKFVDNMTESQWDKIATTMMRDASALFNIPGTDFMAFSSEIADLASLRPKMHPLHATRPVQVMRSMRSFFARQALLTPSFSWRNTYSAAHMNYVVSGLWRKRDYDTGERMLRAVRAEVFDGDSTLIDALPEIEREIARQVYEFIEPRQGRIADRLENVRGVGGRDQSRAGGASSIARNVYFNRLDDWAESLDLGWANIGARRRFFNGERIAADAYGTEEFMRFTQASHSMLHNGLTADSAWDLVVRTHFDYGDLGATDRLLRDTMFPFWTFMSRNLPLQIEMLAKRPQAYNNLLAWQEQTYARNDDGGVKPDYHSETLHYTIPEDVWLLHGDTRVPFLGQIGAITPDLAVNDVLRRTGDLSTLLGLENGASLADLADPDIITSGKFFNLGGVDPDALVTFTLGETSPWTKVWFELRGDEDLFSGRRLTGTEIPITDELPFGGNSVTQVLGVGLAAIGWAERQPVDAAGADPDDTRWYFDAHANQVLRNFMPLLNRASRISNADEADTEAELERQRQAQLASAISFIFGGVRTNRSNEDLIAAYQLSDQAAALLEELEHHDVPRN